jgi:type IV pilus assembly protein PilF
MKWMVLVTAATAALVGCSHSPIEPETPRSDNAAALNVQLGIAYLRQGDLSIAKEKLEKAVKQNPRDPNAHSALALLYERLGKPAEVDAQYRIALRLAPQNPDISNNYAIYLCRNGRAEEGVKRFIEAARNPLYRTPEAAYTNAGVCLRNVKRFEEAEANLKRARQIEPGYAEAAYQLGDLQLDRGRSGDARAQVDQYLAVFNATPELLLLGVRSAQALGDRSGAEKYARRLHVEFPGSSQERALPDLNRNSG